MTLSYIPPVYILQLLNGQYDIIYEFYAREMC